eukprot:1176969-Prorocentrum_minimum.AAC.2
MAETEGAGNQSEEGREDIPEAAPVLTVNSTVSVSGHAVGFSCVRLVRHENIPTLPASDWSVVRIYPRFLRPIGPS